MDPFALIIFGITSNLSQIKLIPAFYDLEEKGLLPKDSLIIGIARQPKDDQEFKQFLSQILKLENKHHKHAVQDEVAKKLLSRFHYLDGHVDEANFYLKLKSYLNKLKVKNKMFYLATYPDLYQSIFENLSISKLNQQDNGWARLMIEKPIGNDFKSAQKLNQLLLKYFQEEQIFRLDHYLGKETLQNILTFRFGNGIFEPLMNKDYVDHIQVTALENFGIGKRGGYYDSVGALKDVGQNHLLQMLIAATMDAPSEFTNQSVTAERIKVLKSLVPFPDTLILGQYEGYKEEENVQENSQTDTFFAFQTEVQNERWKGVPIFIRGGKKLTTTVTEISIIFKTPINRLFKNLECGNQPNILTFRIQPNEGIGLQILSKRPSHEVILDPSFMQFCYRQNENLPDPYERLILDAIKGDPTFFNDSEEVEEQWRIIDSMKAENNKPFIYKSGSFGPQEADLMVEKAGHQWLTPSQTFCAI